MKQPEELYKLSRRIAKVFTNNRDEQEDLMSEGVLGALKLQQTNPEAPSALISRAIFCAMTRQRDYEGRWMRGGRANQISIEDLCVDSDYTTALSHTEPGFDHTINQMYVRSLLPHLAPTQRTAALAVLNHRKPGDAAREAGTTLTGMRSRMKTSAKRIKRVAPELVEMA